MRLRHVFLVTTLLTTWLATQVQVQAALEGGVIEPNDGCSYYTETGETFTAKTEGVPRPVPVPTPLLLTSDKAALGEVYADAFQILREDNSCSNFYG
jgi:hypothetical protein